MDTLSAKALAPILSENIVKEARLMTDEATHYTRIGREYADHGVVAHTKGEYGRGEIHTNTIEGFFSIFKRGMKGVYQHCGKRHLHRYMAEFDFRYNHRSANGVEDQQRMQIALKGVRGKRLTYQQPNP